jgi:intein/homing endonuclease
MIATLKGGSVEYVEVSDVSYVSMDDYTVYRLSVTGNKTFVAEGYVAHNKE